MLKSNGIISLSFLRLIHDEMKQRYLDVIAGARLDFIGLSKKVTSLFYVSNAMQCPENAHQFLPNTSNEPIKSINPTHHPPPKRQKP